MEGACAGRVFCYLFGAPRAAQVGTRAGSGTADSLLLCPGRTGSGRGPLLRWGSWPQHAEAGWQELTSGGDPARRSVSSVGAPAPAAGLQLGRRGARGAGGAGPSLGGSVPPSPKQASLNGAENGRQGRGLSESGLCDYGRDLGCHVLRVRLPAVGSFPLKSPKAVYPGGTECSPPWILPAPHVDPSGRELTLPASVPGTPVHFSKLPHRRHLTAG